MYWLKYTIYWPIIQFDSMYLLINHDLFTNKSDAHTKKMYWPRIIMFWMNNKNVLDKEMMYRWTNFYVLSNKIWYFEHALMTKQNVLTKQKSYIKKRYMYWLENMFWPTNMMYLLTKQNMTYWQTTHDALTNKIQCIDQQHNNLYAKVNLEYLICLVGLKWQPTSDASFFLHSTKIHQIIN